MTPDVALLHEVWEAMKPNIAKGGRPEAAESLVRVFSEYADLSEVEVDINEFDRTMKAAIMEELGLGDEDDVDEWE